MTTSCTASKHGTTSAYMWWGCRCPATREMYRLYRKRLREHRADPIHTDGVGTARRLQALAVQGWCWKALGDRLGISSSRVRQLAYKMAPNVRCETAQRVRDLAWTLADLEAPKGFGASKARDTAARHQWVSLAAWDDIDDPACEPARTADPDSEADLQVVANVLAGRVTWGQVRHPADRLGILHEFDRRGMTPTQACRLLHTSAETYAAIRGRYLGEQVAA